MRLSTSSRRYSVSVSMEEMMVLEMFPPDSTSLTMLELKEELTVLTISTSEFPGTQIVLPGMVPGDNSYPPLKRGPVLKVERRHELIQVPVL